MTLVRPILLPFALVIALAAVLGLVLAGVEGLLGSLVGGVAVGLFLGSSPVMLEPVARRSAALSLPVALAFFGAKAVSVAVLVALFTGAGSWTDRVDRTALGLTAVALALVWTALQVRAVARSRTPIYDLGTGGGADPDSLGGAR